MFPAKTPKPVVALWLKTLQKVMAEDEIKQRLLTGGVESVVTRSPEELQEFIAAEAARWGALAKSSGATAD
jgi:tripartite-type tricarboxylate transporter receptor subunit TctC